MRELDPEIRERAARVRIVLLDVDGVLTDGAIHLSSDGHEDRSFHVRDGLGIRMGQQGGLTFGIISGRESEVVARRAAELGIREVHQRAHDKVERFERILKGLNFPAEAVCFMGDDLIDIPVMRRSGLAVAPADAAPEALEAAHHVTERRGGRGAVRELVDLVLRATGKWDRVTERYLG